MTPTPTVADRFTRDSGIRPSAQGLFKVGVMCGLDPSQASIRRVVRPAEPAQGDSNGTTKRPHPFRLPWLCKAADSW